MSGDHPAESSKSQLGMPSMAVVGNPIIEGRHSLSVNEQKLLYIAISQVNSKSDTEFAKFTISVVDFARLLGREYSSGTIYNEMRELAGSLLKKTITINVDGDDVKRPYEKQFQWVSLCEYHKADGKVVLQLHQELKPYMLELKRRFTQISLEQIYKMKGFYTIRIYEMIIMHVGLKHEYWEMSEEEIRNWLGIEDGKYQRWSALTRDVIGRTQKELDEKADWSFDYMVSRKLHRGKRVNLARFEIRKCLGLSNEINENDLVPKERGYSVEVCLNRLKEAKKAEKSRIAEIARELVPDLNSQAELDNENIVGILLFSLKSELPAIYRQYDKRTEISI